MPVFSAREVVDSRRRAVQLAVSCVSNAVVEDGGQFYPTDSPRTIFLAEDPVPLRGTLRLALSVRQQYVPLQQPGSGEWKFRLTGYLYALDLEGRGELLAFHWHERGASPFQEPHLHLRQAGRMGIDALAAAHVPTGVVLLEDVLRLAIEELGVQPIRRDWSRVLDQTRASFLEECAE